MSSLESLIKPLTYALNVAEPARSHDFRLFFQLLVLRDRPNDAPTEFRELLFAIKSVPELEIFDHTWQSDFDSIDHRFLLGWLISRGQQVGAGQAISDVERYLQVEELELTDFLLIDGVSVSQIESVGDFKIVPWNDVPDTDAKFFHVASGGTSPRVPTAAVTQTFVVPRVHIRPWDQRPFMPIRSIEPQLDLLKCITALTGAGTQLVARWTEPPLWAPWSVKRNRFGANDHFFSTDLHLDANAMAGLASMFASWQAMEEKSRQHFRVPLERLNNSVLQGFRHVDSAIDLGIALESTFMQSNERAPISAAIRLRAARYLASDIPGRRKLSEQMRDVYKLRSDAVHNGRFDATGKWSDVTKVQETLEAGRATLRQALTKIIMTGVPDWEAIELG